MTIYSIYKFTNIINEKVYIGFTSNIENRYKSHKNKSKYGKNKFYCAIRKYGWNNFKFEVIFQSKDCDYVLKEMENFFIVEYDSCQNGYNQTLGGEGTLGWKCPIEIRKKMSASKQGHIPWNKGKTNVYSEEWLKNKSINNIFRTLKKTKKHKENISKALKGRKQSESHKLNSSMGRSKIYHMIDPNGKSIIIKNMSEFCRKNNLHQGHMIGVAKGRYGCKSHKGYTKSL